MPLEDIGPMWSCIKALVWTTLDMYSNSKSVNIRRGSKHLPIVGWNALCFDPRQVSFPKSCQYPRASASAQRPGQFKWTRSPWDCREVITSSGDELQSRGLAAQKFCSEKIPKSQPQWCRWPFYFLRSHWWPSLKSWSYLSHSQALDASESSHYPPSRRDVHGKMAVQTRISPFIIILKSNNSAIHRPSPRNDVLNIATWGSTTLVGNGI